MQAVDEAVLRASVSGAAELLEVDGGFSPRRLPTAAIAQRADDNILVYSALATGVRMRWLTSASSFRVTLRAVRPTPGPDVTPTAPVATLEADGTLASRAVAFSRQWVDATARATGDAPVVATITFDTAPAAAPRPVTLWLPHDAEVTVIGVEADAPVLAAGPEGLPRWTHHGSSISHALEAPGPFGPWPQRAARELGLDLTNVSIAGQAVLDPSVARTIAAHPADLITLKLGINIVNADGFGRRTLGPAVHGFLDVIRTQHPVTPIVVITAIACPIHEDHPGPTIAGPDGRAMPMPRQRHPRDGRLTLTEVREIIGGVVAARADDHLSLLDGRRLFGPDDTDHLPDNLHPDSVGNELIGERFVAIAREWITPRA